MPYSTIRYGKFSTKYRPNTSDVSVLHDVVTKRAYRRPSIGFEIEAGEHWLDLGANIGAFAIYCKLQGATADCYEPEPSCFKLLEINAKGFKCVESAVSDSKATTARLRQSNWRGNNCRGTILDVAARTHNSSVIVPNIFIGDIKERYDGIKIDIEGSELEIIDKGLIPRCDKLVVEYHTSRDKSMNNLKRRITMLRELYTTLSYVPELDRIMSLGGMQYAFHDRLIHCINKKSPQR